MRTSNPHRLTAATAEQLLDGGPGPAGLHQLLAAAAGPGTAGELAGETAAVAAFAAAPHAAPLPSAPTRRPSMLSSGGWQPAGRVDAALSKILAAKALAAVVLLAGATGGVALAASATGGPADPPATGTSRSATPTPDPAGNPSVAPSSAPEATGGSEQAIAEPPATPEPSLPGLCRAWTAGSDNRGASAGNPAFAALVDAAGSADAVPGYCADLDEQPEDTSPGRSAEAPGRDNRPTDPADPAEEADPGQDGEHGRPTAAPGNPDHPVGRPTDAPTGGQGNGQGNGQPRTTDG